jgi:hypothetical protein
VCVSLGPLPNRRRANAGGIVSCVHACFCVIVCVHVRVCVRTHVRIACR